MTQKNKVLGILFLLASILYLFLRFWNLNSLITFHLDQGLQLNEAYQMVQNRKINLIGPMVTTKTFEGRGFFIGPFYTYSLALLGIIFQWNPLFITGALIFLEFLSLILFLYWLSKKYPSSHREILCFFIILATTPFLIEHSRFFWNPHFLLPLSYLFIYLLENKKYFLSSIILGLAFSFHYSAVLWSIPILIYLLKNKESFKKYLIFIPGFILGDLPWFIFEIKHNFYNIKTMFLVFTNTNKAGELSAYYFVFSLLAFFILLIIHFSQKKLYLFYVILILLGLFNLFYKIKLQEDIPVGMPQGWSYPAQKQVVNYIIKNGCPNNFNIATTISGDTRAYDLRYLLTVAKCAPQSVDNYPNAQTLYLIAPPSRQPDVETVWEVTSFSPFNLVETIKINNNIYFYHLEKIKN